MATKMFELSGVASFLEFSKQGYRLAYDSANGWMEVLQSDGSTLGRLQFAEPVASSDGATKNYVDVAISNLIDSAPGTMDTLNEIAQALNDDPNFYTTINNLISEIDVNVDDLITLSGVAENTTNLGTFTGVTIGDNKTVKAALQDLETAHEEVDANVNDVITLTGVAENSVNLGSFAGTTISNNPTIKQALQDLETSIENQEHDCRYASIVYTSGPSVNIGATIPTDSIVSRIRVKVETAWDGTAPTVIGGVSADTDLLFAASSVDLKTPGLYIVDTFVETSGDTQFILTMNNDGSTVGAAKVLLEYCLKA